MMKSICELLLVSWRHRLAAGLVLILLVSLPAVASAAVTVNSIEPLTWNIVGLDSNSPATGPNRFPVGARVCGSGSGSVAATLNWDSSNPYIDLSGSSPNPVTLDFAGSGCQDAYFEVEVDRTALAYDTSRQYHISAGGKSTPTPRELHVEHLVSQARNAISNVEYRLYGSSTWTSVGPGGGFALVKGETYEIRMSCYTATQGYEQLESFSTLPNTIFQLLGVTTTYTADTTSNVSSPSDKLYGDACTWENDPASPNYLACNSEGKIGGTIAVTYRVKIIAVPGSGTPIDMLSLIYDFSGSSFHYNSDYDSGGRSIIVVDPASVTLSKDFAPDPINLSGVSTLTFSLTNPNDAAVTAVSFSDNLPTAPAAMVVANPPAAAVSGCGTPTFVPTAGATTLAFTDGTIAANSTCTVKVNVSTPLVGTYANTSGNLSVGAIDTGNFATDTLTVNNVPPQPQPVCGLTMANWGVPAGSSNPPDATGGLPVTQAVDVATATAAAFIPGSTQIATDTDASHPHAWEVWGFKSANQYLDFTLDTRNYTSIFMSFYVRSPTAANGPNNLYVDYSTNGGASFNNAYTVNYAARSFPSTFTQHTIDLTTLASTTGSTILRIRATGANNDVSSGGLRFDDILFQGCAVPLPPRLTKSFSPNPVAVDGTSTLTFTASNPNPNTALALDGIAFSDTLPAGLSVASGSTSPVCGGTLTTTAPTGISFSAGTLAANSSCTIPVTVTADSAGTHDNVSGYISGRYSGTTYTNYTATGSATASLTALLPPVIAKAFSPNPIYTTANGGYATLTFTLANPNPGNALSGVAFIDTYPAGLVNRTPANAWTDCSGGSVTASDGGSAVALSGATLAAGGSCTVRVDVEAAATGDYANAVTVTHALNGTWNGNTASDTLTVGAPNPQIALLKQVGPSAGGPWSSGLVVVAGSDVHYRFTVENIGDVPLDSIAITDPLVSTAGCSWPASLPVADALDNGHIASCTVGPITALSGSHPNTAHATGTYSGTPYNSADSTATYTTSTLTLVKSATETFFVAAGDTLHYSYAVTNDGAVTLTGPVTISDNKVGSFTCSAADLAPGATAACTAEYIVTATDVTNGLVTNVARASVGGIYSPTASKTVNKLTAELSVVKSNNLIGNLAPDNTFDWILTVANATGAADAVFADGQVILLDQLPLTGAGYGSPVYAGADITGTIACAIDDGSKELTCTAGGAVTIPAGKSFTVTIPVTITSIGYLYNPRKLSDSPLTYGICKVDANDLILETNEADNSCANIVQIGTPLLAIAKTADKAVTGATSGEVITYTIQVNNTGTGVARSVTLRDDMSLYTAFKLDYDDAAPVDPFLLTDTTTAPAVSGLTMGTPQFADDGGMNPPPWPYTLTDQGGGAPAGYDGNVTNWRIPMNGQLNVGGSISLKYKVIVK